MFHRDTREPVGLAYYIRPETTEFIHIRQPAQASQGTVDLFAHTVFNSPTFAECSGTAWLDGLNRL